MLLDFKIERKISRKATFKKIENTPWAIGDVTNTVDHEDEVARRKAQEVGEAIRQNKDLPQVKQTRGQEDARQTSQIQCRHRVWNIGTDRWKECSKLQMG